MQSLTFHVELDSKVCCLLRNSPCTPFRFGRRITFVITVYGTLLFMLAEVFCHTAELYALCRLFLAFFLSAGGISIFVHGTMFIN